MYILIDAVYQKCCCLWAAENWAPINNKLGVIVKDNLGTM